MNCLALVITEHLGGLMLVGAAVAFYIASRAAGDAMSSGGYSSPVRHALAQWGAIACVCVVAVWLDHAEIAVGVIFSTAVAALSLHLGVTIATSPHAARAHGEGHGFDFLNPNASSEAQAIAPPARFGAVRGSRAWAMLLPVGFLALMVGFSGKLTLTHALLFAIQGLFVVMVWKDAKPPNVRSRLPSASRAQLALSLILAMIGAICAVYGATRMSQETGIMSTGLIASAALGPLLVLPMIGSASLLASHGEGQTAVGASVVIVLLNLCLLLPIVVVGWHVREQYFPSTSTMAAAAAAAAPSRPAREVTTRPATTRATTDPVADDEFGVDEPPLPDDMPRVLSFPIAVWRIDTVLLILLGLMLLPVSLNLWEMRRAEGILLIAIYACYLIATTVLGRRW